MIPEMIIKIIAGMFGTLGFAILFKLKARHLPFSIICGFVACIVYFPLSAVLDGIFVPNFFAAFSTAIMAEIFAIVCKTPTTAFLFTGCITLVPGSFLFYGMSSLLEQSYEQAANYFLMTLNVAIAIGGGIIASSLVRIAIKTVIIEYKKRKEVKQQ